MKEIIYLGIGSNLGDREANIREAAEQCSRILGEFMQSRIYESLPRYVEKQPKFLNCVFSGVPDLEPHQLLSQLQKIEEGAGRNREASGKMGPRPIDLDILLYGRRKIHTDALKVPHPRMKERKFVLVPLLDLDPLLRDPITDEAYSDILDQLEPQGIYYHGV